MRVRPVHKLDTREAKTKGAFLVSGRHLKRFGKMVAFWRDGAEQKRQAKAFEAWMQQKGYKARYFSCGFVNEEDQGVSWELKNGK